MWQGSNVRLAIVQAVLKAETSASNSRNMQPDQRSIEDTPRHHDNTRSLK